MIRINLAKSSGAKRGVRGVGSAGTVVVVLLFLALLGGGYYYIEYESEVSLDDILVNVMSGELPSFGGKAVDPVAAALDKLVEASSKESSSGESEEGEPDKSDVPSEEQPIVQQPITPPPTPVQKTGVPPAASLAQQPITPPSPPVQKTGVPPAAPLAQQPITPPPPPVQKAGVTQGRANMVEDVVRELGNETRAVSKLNAAYDEMTVAEKINYEVLFARNVFEMVTRCAPQGIMLRTLEIENFQTVYASGVGSSREMVQEMFAAFKGERGELMPRPLSHIKDDDRGGFQFVVTFKPRFGLELSDPFQALDHLGFKEGLMTHLRNFTRLAAGNGFKMTGAPSQASAERTGGYRRVVYRVSGTSTYRDFHKLVMALHGEKVPCAFKKITLTPVKDEQVRVSAEILFTVKQ